MMDGEQILSMSYILGYNGTAQQSRSITYRLVNQFMPPDPPKENKMHL